MRGMVCPMMAVRLELSVQNVQQSANFYLGVLGVTRGTKQSDEYTLVGKGRDGHERLDMYDLRDSIFTKRLCSGTVPDLRR